jgi:hypothetical protein
MAIFGRDSRPSSVRLVAPRKVRQIRFVSEHAYAGIDGPRISVSASWCAIYEDSRCAIFPEYSSLISIPSHAAGKGTSLDSRILAV